MHSQVKDMKDMPTTEIHPLKIRNDKTVSKGKHQDEEKIYTVFYNLEDNTISKIEKKRKRKKKDLA